MDENHFEPTLGRLRTTPSPRGRKYLHRVIAAVALAGGVRRKGAQPFSGARIGRGAATGRLLASRDGYRGLRSRRAIVKARLVRLAGQSFAGARAHLRYIERDGVAREGEEGCLYSSVEDAADGRAFLERSQGDRHQFRFIVSAEDGAEYDDLKPLIRRVMAKMEEDLGTRLEWVAADHLDTLHPHTHVMLRGKDDSGQNLIIARDYLARGLRERVAEQVSLDLGPRTDLEIRDRLRREVTAERLTSIDRRLIRDLDEARSLVAGGRDVFDHSLRAGRLRKLEALGLAEPLGGARWRLADDLEQTLRTMSERGDIVRTMQRALTARGLKHPPAERIVHAQGLESGPLVGRLVVRGLSDEASDRHYLIIEATDGRIHYVDAGRGEATEPLPENGIIRIEPGRAEVRAADHKVAEIAAANGGRYSQELHLSAEPGTNLEYQATHIRRLEAIRRAVGGPERLADGSWVIGEDHLTRASAFEARRLRHQPVRVELLSGLRLEQLAGAQGATWLDRELLSDEPLPLREAGFGAEVRAAKAARTAWLLKAGLAVEGEEGVHYRADLVGVLRQRDLLAVSAGLTDEFGLPARAAEPGERVSGVLRRRLDLASGRFGLMEGASELVLVPWRPELERELGRALDGRVGPGGLSWSRGQTRGPEIG